MTKQKAFKLFKELDNEWRMVVCMTDNKKHTGKYMLYFEWKSDKIFQYWPYALNFAKILVKYEKTMEWYNHNWDLRIYNY